MRARRRVVDKRATRKESDLCESFMRAARLDGWTPYPETARWDLVLVRGDVTVGVEAKLSGNCAVLSQAHGRARYSGPTHRAVLVPHVSRAFEHVARALRLGVYTLANCGETRHRKRGYVIARRPIEPPPYAWSPTRKLWLPPIVPSTVAGAPAPRALTPWRVKALRFIIGLEARGYVTSEHFREVKIDRSIWVDRWLDPDGKIGRLTRYVIREPRRADFPSHGYEADLERLRELGSDA